MNSNNQVRTITSPSTYAAVYLRLSRDDQNGNSDSMSIINQRDMLTEYCEERGWKVYDIYVDDGFTGTNFERPGFQRMIEDIKSGMINVVLTKDLSRLGRNYVLTGQYTDFFFPEHGVRYVAVNDSYDSAKDDNDIAPFKNILNEMYAKDISKKIRSARATGAKQGKFMGSKPPYGYTKTPEDKHKLVIDPMAAEVVRRIFREYAGGDSARSIADKLNADNIDTPAVYYFKMTGKRATRSDNCHKWGSQTLMDLLRNQAYLGHMVQGKRKVSSFKTKKRVANTKDAWIIVENTHEPLVSLGEWEAVKTRLLKAEKAPTNSIIKRSKADGISLFSGIIKCADCGAGMAFNHKTRKNGAAKLIYRCSRHANNGSSVCTAHTIDAEVLEQVLLSDIQSHAKTAVRDEKGLLDRLLAFSTKACRNESAAQEKTLRDTESRISFIETAGKQLFEERVSGNVPDAMFKKMLSDYQQEIETLTQQASELRSQTQDSRNNQADIQRWMSLIKEYSAIKRLDRAMVYQLIDQVSVHEQSDECGIRTQAVQIKYNFVGQIDLN